MFGKWKCIGAEAVWAKEAQQRYNKSEKGKASQERYRATPNYLAAKLARRPYEVEKDRFRRTGWTPEAYSVAFKAQDGICAIAGCTRAIHDADHIEYGGRKIPRALLCRYHNSRLSHYDNPRPELIDYVAQYRGERALITLSLDDYLLMIRELEHLKDLI